MKWVVVALVLFNALLWFSAERWGDGDSRASLSHGRLPRVAPIEIIDVSPPDSSSNRPAGRPPDVVFATPAPKVAQRGGEDVSKTAPDACLRIGWFASPEDARSFAKALDVTVATNDVVPVARQQRPLHWVLLPGSENRADALVRYRQLQDQGMEAYVLAEGERRNSISLGLFQSSAAAREVLEQARQQGWEPQIESFEREEVVYAVDFRGQNAARIRQTGAQIMAPDRVVEQVEMKACQGVATPLKSP